MMERQSKGKTAEADWYGLNSVAERKCSSVTVQNVVGKIASRDSRPAQKKKFSQTIHQPIGDQGHVKIELTLICGSRRELEHPDYRCRKAFQSPLSFWEHRV